MVSKIVNLQMSFFGAFSEMKPKADVLMKLVNVLGSDEFIPGSVDITNIEPTTGKIITDSRMQMSSPDKIWTIVFLPNRIDFNYNYQDGTNEYQKLESLIEFGEKIIREVFGEFRAIKGNRLAVNCRLVYEGLTDSELQHFCYRFVKPLMVYESHTFEEWTVRFNSRANLKISDSDVENCNRLVEIAQMERINPTVVTSESLYDIVATIDVNTDATDPSFRFESPNFEYFIQQAKSFMNKAIIEIEEV